MCWKQRYHSADKGLYSQGYGLSSGNMRLWDLNCKKAEQCRIDAFELWCWRRLPRVPWTARRSNQSILRKSTLNTHWKDWCLSSSILVLWFEQLTHWKSPWFWERLRTEEEGIRGWDGWMASPMQWAWTWTNFGRWWGTGRPCILQSMGSQRVGHDWVT